MDPAQCVVEDVNPRLETAGSTSAVVADGYDAMEWLVIALDLDYI